MVTPPLIFPLHLLQSSQHGYSRSADTMLNISTSNPLPPFPAYLSPDAIMTGLVITKEVAGVTFQDTNELTLKEAHCQSLRV